jgi:endogenous inhibitor of DNA gyrase (YacG/DUF329 family)
MRTSGKNDQAAAADEAKTPKCPICGQPREPEYRPFCSKRCADLDLGRWLNGSYAIPVSEDDDEDGEQGLPASPEAASHDGDPR